MNNKKAIELLQKLTTVTGKYDYSCATWELKNLISRLHEELDRHQLSENFDIPVDALSLVGDEWYRIRAYPEEQYLGYYGNGNNREVSWSDDDRQPEDEWLFTLKFSSGAYIFGEDYPKETFNAFFNELKEFSPKYIDTVNSALYFDGKNAGEVYRNLKDIYLKHKAEVQKELDKKRIAKLKAELEKLEGSGE